MPNSTTIESKAGINTNLTQQVHQQRRSSRNAAANYWSSNVNLKNFSSPAYSIPSQHYPGRATSPADNSRNQQHKQVISSNTMSRRRISHKGGATPNSRLITSRSSGGGAVSPASSGSGHQYFSNGDLTPGCTDYTPRAEQLLK